MKNGLIVLSILILSSCGVKTPDATKEQNATTSNFKWDFSKQRTFVYSFSQTVTGEDKTDKTRLASKTNLTGIGNIHVRVKENDFADVSIANLQITTIDFDEEGKSRDTTTHEVPVAVVQDMKPNGRFFDSNTDMLFQLLFPLPNRDLAQNEFDSIPMQIPFNANGSRLFVKGQNILTFTGYKDIEGRRCAVLNGTIDISQLEIPEELSGEYICSTRGEATYYFDLENGYYFGVDAHVGMKAVMDSETENEDDFGMYFELKNDNTFKIRLERIEE